MPQAFQGFGRPQGNAARARWVCGRGFPRSNRLGFVLDVWSWDLFYLTEYRVAAADLQDDGCVLERFDIFVCAGVDQHEVTALDFAELCAVIADGDVFVRVIFRDVRFALDEELRVRLIELFNGFLVASQPVVRFVFAERSAGAACKRIVIRVFVGMQLNEAINSRRKQEEGQCTDNPTWT